ncbi:cytosolic phospholipase A2 gamma-like [Hyperolius riggenbachi]|uniref:cytosolic phospholipase A2 gamma-like n=1 Tax=Hyperolius riggenbachi TaxID=752182 RepID=UPI0035A283E5
MENAEDKEDIINESEGEELSMKARRGKVMEAFRKHGFNIQENVGPPVIAVLGSGGGSRAMAAFLGTLCKLAELKLLDLVTYVGGTSGSTWCMTSLYANENWTNVDFLKEKEKQIFKSGFSWKTAWKKIKAAYAKEQHSLTDFWAYVAVYFMTGEMPEEKLSEHKKRCEKGNIPYPVYSAVEKDTGIWCEFTPHVCGFPKYKSFVNTEHLGSKFEAGSLSKPRPEMDLCYLRGLWGSAPASDDIIAYAIEELLSKLMPWWSKFKEIVPLKSEETDKELPEEEMFNMSMRMMAEELPKEAVGHMREKRMARELSEDEDLFQAELSCTCSECTRLKRLLVDISTNLRKTDMKELVMMQEEVKDQMILTAGHKLKTDPEHIEPKKCKMNFGLPSVVEGTCKVGRVLKNILSSLTNWEWGTINGFLYKWKEEVCPVLAAKKEISLVDAGLFINAPYPLMLPPHRNVDLILSVDFSSGDPFATLSKTAEYCKEHKIPFPNVEIKETSKQENEKGEIIPLDCCYIFEGDGKGAPTVMHFPLFNNQTCEGKVTEMADSYSTFKLNYEEPELEKLLEVAKKNVEESYKKIAEKLRQLVERRKNMGTAANGLH